MLPAQTEVLMLFENTEGFPVSRTAPCKPLAEWSRLPDPGNPKGENPGVEPYHSCAPGPYPTAATETRDPTKECNMTRKARTSIVFTFAALLQIPAAHGQSTYGSIVGDVKDSSDAVIGGAAVTLTNIET